MTLTPFAQTAKKLYLKCHYVLNSLTKFVLYDGFQGLLALETIINAIKEFEKYYYLLSLSLMLKRFNQNKWWLFIIEICIVFLFKGKFSIWKLSLEY